MTAYEDSPYAAYINRQNYLAGYFDALDTLDSTYHWIVEENGQIVGSVRVAVINDLKDMNEDIDHLQPTEARLLPIAAGLQFILNIEVRRL